MKKFYIADNHFMHGNIIKHTDRPFQSVSEMDKTMVDNWNSVVSKQDMIYILGDLAMAKGRASVEKVNKLLSTLNGNKVFIRGNHDHFLDSPHFDKSLLHSVHDYLRITDKVNGKVEKVCLFHYPLWSWDCGFHGSYHLFGHVHNAETQHAYDNAFNVGVEVINYTPITLQQLVERRAE